MQAVFESMLQALRDGDPVALVSVIASSGSTPRGTGAKMAVRMDGSTRGTIGGGAVEFACAKIAREALQTGAGGVRSFTLAPGDPANLGMVCGGRVEVCFQVFSPKDARALALLPSLLSLFEAGKDAWLITRIDGDDWRMGTYDRQNGLRHLEGVSSEAILPLLGPNAALERGDAVLYVEPLVREGTVYVFGGGHVSKALLPLLRSVDFRPVVFEDRPEFVGEGILGDFSAIGQSIAITASDAVVIMTRGHEADYLVLSQVLRTSARYIGMIGSKRKLGVTLDKLRAEGFQGADFERLHSPIGLAIGAETPAEIAVSIAAEMIRERAAWGR